MNEITLSLILCGVSLLLTILATRSFGRSLGLPVAYLFVLLLNHAPGAYAHLVRPDLFNTTEYVEIGIWQTAIATLCFMIGVLVSRLSHENASANFINQSRLDARFWLFCLFGGWIFVYALAPLQSIPSLGALIEKGGALWMLGVMLGLRDAWARANWTAMGWWLAALAVYPTLMFLLGGFASYGTVAIIIVTSVLVVSTRNIAQVIFVIAILIPIILSLFVNYFIARDYIRSVTWSDASFSARLNAATEVFSSIEPLNMENDKHADALDQRLNQNYFSGLATMNLQNGLVEYLRGQSLYDAAIAVIPRALWPNKPVIGGSGSIVRDLTKLELSETTSWGVGQVMEFFINFGWYSLAPGFLALGWVIGKLDITAASAEHNGDVRTLFVCFLPAVALIQPIGSLVELVGGAMSAYIVANGWSYVWAHWNRNFRRRHAMRDY